VSFKTTHIRVFYVDNPNDYLELPQPEINWFIFVSKLGYNVLSDRTGLLALGGMNSPALSIFNLITK
jgi:hypothetical protein